MTESDEKRARVVEMVRKLMENTVENGCTPGEAAKFAAKAAELVERYQIEEAELRAQRTGKAFSADDLEMTENVIRTGKKVHNPGMTSLLNGLALGSCCKILLKSERGEAIYGVIGDRSDADYVCQIASSIVPALQIMGRMEGVEHGREKAGLVRWLNQYLAAAGWEIKGRLEAERKARSDARVADHQPTSSSTALAVITGETLAVIKRQAAEEAMRAAYPDTKKYRGGRSREYDCDANERGREAGRSVGLHVGVGDNSGCSGNLR